MQAVEVLQDASPELILKALDELAPKLAQLPRLITDLGDIRRRLAPGILANVTKLYACARVEGVNG